jgi:hypothetical protein
MIRFPEARQKYNASPIRQQFNGLSMYAFHAIMIAIICKIDISETGHQN